MNKIITLITASAFTVGLAISSASAFQAAPQSAEKAKEMMEKNSEKHNESSPSRVFVEKYKEFNIFKVHYDYFVPDLVIQDSKQNYASLDVAKIIIDEELKGEYQTFFLSYRFYKIIVVSLVLLYISGIIYQNM